MVSIRSVVIAALALLPLIDASSTTSSKTSKLSTKSTSKTTSTSAAATPLCSQEAQGILVPQPGATIVQTNDGNYGPNYFTVVYCSGAYYKTSSIDGSVWLTFPDEPTSGQLLIKDEKPDNKDAHAAFYSYRFNVTLYPEDGDYVTGERTLSVYETTTGEFV